MQECSLRSQCWRQTFAGASDSYFQICAPLWALLAWTKCVFSPGSGYPSQGGRVRMGKEPCTVLSPWPRPSEGLGEAKERSMNESAHRAAEAVTQPRVMISLFLA